MLDGCCEAGMGNRGMTGRLLINARMIGKSGEPWYISNRMSFTRSFLLGPVFFRTALSCSGSYRLERDGRPLHDAVRINCRKGATTENEVYICAKCMLMILCVLSDLT